MSTKLETKLRVEIQTGTEVLERPIELADFLEVEKAVEDYFNVKEDAIRIIENSETITINS